MEKVEGIIRKRKLRKPSINLIRRRKEKEYDIHEARPGQKQEAGKNNFVGRTMNMG